MMKNYYRYLHRCLYRFYIKLYKKNNKDYYSLRSTLEPYVISLCKKLLKKPNVTLLTSYELNKFYIIFNDVVIIIKSNECEIIDGVNHYNTTISPKTNSIIMNVFNGKLKEKREELENNYLKNVNNSLKILCEKF